MDDVKALLERARREAPPTRVALGEVKDASDHGHARRRLGAAVREVLRTVRKCCKDGGSVTKGHSDRSPASWAR
jgi:hypothetical protein